MNVILPKNEMTEEQAREAAQEVVKKRELEAEQTRSLFESLMKEINTAMPEEFNDDTLNALLGLSEENFAFIAPAFLSEFEKSLNNVNDKLSLVYALNAAGLSLDDLREQYISLINQLDEATVGLLSIQKRDFLKQLLSITYNMVADTQGITKKIIEIPMEICNPDATTPAYAHVTDAGMDVFALEDITIEPGETKLIPIGIKVAIPFGYELQVRPKSGRCLKTKLRIANTPGTIDSGYRDEIGVIVENIDPPIRAIRTANLKAGDTLTLGDIEFGQSYTIGKGEKFAQLVLSEVPKANFFEVESVAKIEGDRGGGFGSTGLK